MTYTPSKFPRALHTNNQAMSGPGTVQNGDTGYVDYTGSYTIPYTGYWTFSFRTEWRHSSGPTVHNRITVAGSQVGMETTVELGAASSNWTLICATSTAVSCSSGQVVRAQWRVSAGSAYPDANAGGWGGSAPQLYYTFVPTPANPQ